MILVTVVKLSQLSVIRICKSTVQMRKKYKIINPNIQAPQRNNQQKKATNKPFRSNVNHKKDLPLIDIEVYVLAFEILRPTSTISLRKRCSKTMEVPLRKETRQNKEGKKRDGVFLGERKKLKP